MSELLDYQNKLREIFEQHRFKHAVVENYGKAQVIQDLLEDCGLYIEAADDCEHNYDFDPRYIGNCPQPKQCARCGKMDYNGYRGAIIK